MRLRTQKIGREMIRRTWRYLTNCQSRCEVPLDRLPKRLDPSPYFRNGSYEPSDLHKRRRIERGFSMGLWAEIRKPEPRKPDFGHPEEQLSGLHKDLNGAIRRAGPEPSGLEAYIGEGGRCAVRIRRVWGVGCSEPGATGRAPGLYPPAG